MADAGTDQIYDLHCVEHPGHARRIAACASPDGPIVQYTWSKSGLVVGTGALASATLGAGEHTFELLVIDGAGRSAVDTLRISVVAEVQYHVAANGNDAWSGRLAAPLSDSSDGKLFPQHPEGGQGRAGRHDDYRAGRRHQGVIAYQQHGTATDPITLKAADGCGW